MRKRYVYLVGTSTGQYSAEGVEIIIVYATCQTRSAAEDAKTRNPGTDIFKQEALDTI